MLYIYREREIELPIKKEKIYEKSNFLNQYEQKFEGQKKRYDRLLHGLQGETMIKIFEAFKIAKK